MRSFTDRKSTRLNSSHLVISYAVFCLKKKVIPARAPTAYVSPRLGYRIAGVAFIVVLFGFFFFFNDTATTEIYTLSLHDALPICEIGVRQPRPPVAKTCQKGA